MRHFLSRALVLMTAFTGCASRVPTTPTSVAKLPYRLYADSVTYGQDHKRLDRAERAVHWPARFFSANKLDPRNEPSPETTDRILDYLDQNDISDVHVYVHHYDPAGQWSRLVQNKKVGPGWRYTFGTMSWARYTVFPGRVFGISEYNPYTNSLYANSEETAMLVAEAAKAKEMQRHKYRGTYLAYTSLPGFSLIPHYRSVNEVVEHAQEDGDWELERQAYLRLYPRAGSETLSTFMSPVPLTWWAQPAVGMAGGAVGRTIGVNHAEKRAADFRSTALLEQTRTAERFDMPERTVQFEQPPDEVSSIKHADAE